MSSPGEDKACQRSTGSLPALGQLAAKLGKGDRLAPLDLAKTCLQRGEGIRMGENLGSLLQRLVLVYRNQSCGRRPIAGDEHVVAAIADVVEQAAEVILRSFADS